MPKKPKKPSVTRLACAIETPNAEMLFEPGEEFPEIFPSRAWARDYLRSAKVTDSDFHGRVVRVSITVQVV